MARSLAELSPKERLDEVPGYEGPNGSRAHTNDVHVVVLAPLVGREVVVHQPSADSRYLVCTDCRADATAADRHPALNLPCRHSPGEGDDEVGIIVARFKKVRPEVDYLMPRTAETGNQVFL